MAPASVLPAALLTPEEPGRRAQGSREPGPGKAPQGAPSQGLVRARSSAPHVGSPGVGCAGWASSQHRQPREQAGPTRGSAGTEAGGWAMCYPPTLHHNPHSMQGWGAGRPRAPRARGREGGGLTRSRGGTGPVFCDPAAGGRAPGPASQQAITHLPPGPRPGPALGTAPGLEALPGCPSSRLGPPRLG